MSTKHLYKVLVLLLGIWLLVALLALVCTKTVDADDIPAAIPLVATPVPQAEPASEPEPELWRITAYCSCEKCCGKWAAGRTTVTGAGGVELKAGTHCAAPLPFGTVVEIDGVGTYEVQDRTSTKYAKKHGGRVVDIYFDDHEAARCFGWRYAEVTVIANANER